MTESLVDKNGDIIPHGSLISWNVWDNDDCKMWTFVGIVKDYTQLEGVFHSKLQQVIYLGGGIDFGSAIGTVMDFDEVRDEADNNDPQDVGITVLGKASDVPNILKKEFGI